MLRDEIRHFYNICYKLSIVYPVVFYSDLQQTADKLLLKLY